MNRHERRAMYHQARVHGFGKHSAKVRPANLERRREYVSNCGDKAVAGFQRGRAHKTA